jgi:hypothetical protein
MKRIWLLSLLTLSATWILTGASFANEKLGMKAPEAEIIIEGEKKSARFSHPVHLGLDNNLQLRCASCHNKDFADPKLQTPKSAFHARCKECHKKGVDGKKGPTKCTDCHVKKAK